MNHLSSLFYKTQNREPGTDELHTGAYVDAAVSPARIRLICSGCMVIVSGVMLLIDFRHRLTDSRLPATITITGCVVVVHQLWQVNVARRLAVQREHHAQRAAGKRRLRRLRNDSRRSEAAAFRYKESVVNARRVQIRRNSAQVKALAIQEDASRRAAKVRRVEQVAESLETITDDMLWDRVQSIHFHLGYDLFSRDSESPFDFVMMERSTGAMCVIRCTPVDRVASMQDVIALEQWRTSAQAACARMVSVSGFSEAAVLKVCREALPVMLVEAQLVAQWIVNLGLDAEPSASCVPSPSAGGV